MSKKREKGEANLLLQQHMDELRIPWVAEYKFHPTRKWRADYRLGKSVLVEIEGGIYTRGRHSRGAGMEADIEKYNAAIALGYKLYRFSTGQVLTGKAREFLKENL